MNSKGHDPMIFFDKNDMATGLKDVGGLQSVLSSDFESLRTNIVSEFDKVNSRISSVRKRKFGKGWEEI